MIEAHHLIVACFQCAKEVKAHKIKFRAREVQVAKCLCFF